MKSESETSECTPEVNITVDNTDIDYTSDEETVDDIDNSPHTELAQWAIQHNITHIAISALLKILNTFYDPSLVTDARTLLKTNVSTAVIPLKDISPGKYYHFGIANGIKNHYIDDDQKELNLVVGIDGLPLTKSTKSTFWPILCYIRPYSNIVFPIGIYYGNDKPKDSNVFLNDFYNEIKYLINTGINIKKKSGELGTKKIILDVFCCDVPAKSYILKTKGHSGFFSCSRCFTEGEFLNRRVCFPELNNCRKRTHENFINKEQEEYHIIGPTMSILIDIPGIDIVNDFSLDYMHMVCLGVVKKLINLWLKGPLNNRLNSAKCKLIIDSLLSLKEYITKDFQRKPRGIDQACRWKATEFRTFLLYLGPVELKNIINKKCYSNFLYLHVSMSILLRTNCNIRLIDFSKELLNFFVNDFANIYGKEWVSHNVHALQHINYDYSKFGPLDNCSAFPFENHMKVLKKYIRKSHQPLQQAVKRYSEYTTYGFKLDKTKNNSNLLTFKNSHTDGPLMKEFMPFSGIQYKAIIFKNYEIKINHESDSFVQITDGNIIKIKNICKINNESFILGYSFRSMSPFYTKPIDSTKLGIYLVDNLSNNLSNWQVETIQSKCMLLKIKNKTIAFLVIHTIEM